MAHEKKEKQGQRERYLKNATEKGVHKKQGSKTVPEAAIAAKRPSVRTFGGRLIHGNT